MLQAELRAERTGRVVEIGERALVTAFDGQRFRLALAGPEADVATCGWSELALERPTRRRPATPWQRRHDAAAA